MKVNLEKAVKTIKKDVEFFRPLYEAIVNSVQAKATEININFDLKKESHADIIHGYTIEDNGEGFTNSNIDSFLTLWSDHNSDMGALGSGRILCLKVFDNIIINSQTKDTKLKSGQKVSIDFNKKFTFNTVEEVNIENNSSDKSFTTTHYTNLTKSYETKKEIFNLKVLKREFFIALLPLFIRYYKEETIFSISIENEIWINNTSLETTFKDLKFKTIDINVPSSTKDDESTYDFKLTYQINKDGENTLHQFYGASDRKVKSFPTNTGIKRLPDNASGIFCLTGDYLKDRVADSREDFTTPMNENNVSEEHPLLFRDINLALSNKLNEILKSSFPKIEESLAIEKNDAMNENPYLTAYIKDITKLTIKKSEIIKIAESKFNKKFKETKKDIIKFTKSMEKTKNFNKSKYIKITQDFTEVGQEQLAHYIAYRQTIIEMLFYVHECNNDNNKESFNEDYIHNLIMPKNKIKFSQKNLITENNFWLFDDKFMSYSYTASDTEIDKILKSLEIEMDDVEKDYFGKDRPDLMMLYSDEVSKSKDVVIVELKKINISSYDRSKAVDQVNLYADIIREEMTDIDDIFVYVVVDLDHKLERILRTRSFLPKSYTKDGHNMMSYYMYNPNNKSHVTVLSFKHLIADASTRNKLFLDILKNETTNEETINN